MNELFEHQLQDIFWAEKELGNFMPKLMEKISSKELKNTLAEHARITEKQVRRLENIFEIIGAEKKGEKCDGLVGLMEEAESVIDMAEEGAIRDAFIIGSVQKVEHYEMASYGTLRVLAIAMGEYEVATLLGETLKEEKEADLKLTQVAENVVNIEASREAGVLEGPEDELDIDDEEEFEAPQAKGSSKSKK